MTGVQACARRADAIWFNGQLLTMDPAQPRAQAIAVRAGRILAVGPDEQVLALCGPGTRRIDLHGASVLPGLIDTHVHALLGGLRDTVEISVPLSAGLDALLRAVRERCRTAPPGEWIIGGQWHMRELELAGLSPRALLDAAAPEHPVCLRDATLHSVWVNSPAMKACAIHPSTADPQGGRIERDAEGRPTGVLLEGAQRLVQRFILPTPAQLRRAALHVREYFHSMGLTGFKEAMANEALLQAYCDADRAGELKLHVAAHVIPRPLLVGEMVPLETVESWRSRYRSPHVRADFIKLVLDGVVPMRTASFLEPYAPACGQGMSSKYDPDALLLIDPETLAQEVIEYDRRGFTLKLHAIGDRAARVGLNAIEAARLANGNSGLRHEIGHTTFVDETDIPRFAQLGAIAEMSPRMWFPNPMTAGQRAVLGPARVNRYHRMRTLLAAGAELTYGSDWPGGVDDANPWVGLAGMLSRRNPLGLFEGALGEQEAIPLEQALPMMTINGARSMRLESITGSLTAGKSADFVVLEGRPLADATPAQIAAAQVRSTIFEGEVVYAAA